MSRILLIDDDANLVKLLSAYLTGLGYTIQNAGDGKTGLKLLYQETPDLVLLDVTMPVRDGWDTLERIRELSEVPVIMLTARDEEVEILRGFSLGADDYVTKPFSFAQLGARIQAVLTRSQKGETSGLDELVEGDLAVNLHTDQVLRGADRIRLTPTEFKLLVALMKRAGDVLSPEELVREVWGPQYAGEVGHVRRYVYHLRHKLEINPEKPQYIHNERGFGYRFQFEPESSSPVE